MKNIVVITLLILTCIPFYSCTSKEESARKMYNEALTLQQDNQSEAMVIYKEIVEKYPETQTSIYANEKLFAYNGYLKVIRKNIISALNSFQLDNGRYPTTEEGLTSLVSNSAELKAWEGPYIFVKFKPYINDFTYTHNSGSDYQLLIKSL